MASNAVSNILEDLLLTSSKPLASGAFECISSLVEKELTENEEGIEAEELLELLRPFLLNFADEEAATLCRRLLRRLRMLGNDDDDDDQQVSSSDFLPDGPVSIRELIKRVESRGKVQTSSGGDKTRGNGQSSGFDDNEEASSKGGGFDDPFLGLQKNKANWNSAVPIAESVSIAKAAAKKREKQLRTMRQWENSKQPLPLPIRRHGDASVSKLQDIVVPSFSVSVAGRELLKDAPLRLVLGRRYGLIGRNGIGKTTLLSAMVRGEVAGIDKDISIACLEQEFSAPMDLTPLEIVLQVDAERAKLLEEEKSLLALNPQMDETGKRLAIVYTRLEEIEANKAESQAASILSGLGLSLNMYHEKKLSDLSGGWRMRVQLARVLFADPDVLCLDEPTNHLDLHAVAWLSQFLKKSAKTVIIVSHARHFLNEVCTDIIEFRDRSLFYYTGDYDTYERTKSEKQIRQQKEFEKQQAYRDHQQQFIDKFRFNSNRAALVQSRIKAMAKLPMLQAVAEDPSLQFKFSNPEQLPTPVCQLSNVCFTYGSKESKELGRPWLINDVDLTIDFDTRAAICGVNGSGKSTLVKLLVGHLEENEGVVFRHSKLKIGYFAQHHVDSLDLTKNAVQQLQERYPQAKLTDEAARAFLGKFGISGMLALEPLFILSGGQKSRVAIALTAFAEPHILVMDEPTNHLDLDAVSALIAALSEFEGGVVLVSHDAHLLSCVVEEVYHMNSITGRLEKFKGDFEEYKAQLLKGKKH